MNEENGRISKLATFFILHSSLHRHFFSNLPNVLHPRASSDGIARPSPSRVT
jgi:hypothetical protein